MCYNTIVIIYAVIITVTSQPPNILLFLVDDLGYGDLGYTGHPTTHSPNVDSLARSGKVRYFSHHNLLALNFIFLTDFYPVLCGELSVHPL